jgi:hypothetical protein
VGKNGWRIDDIGYGWTEHVDILIRSSIRGLIGYSSLTKTIATRHLNFIDSVWDITFSSSGYNLAQSLDITRFGPLELRMSL